MNNHETDPITPQVSDRICRHMNNDHQKAIIAYGHHYAGVENINNAKLVKITSKGMTLEIDEDLIEIPFEHTLEDSGDAHRTLVAMLKAIPING